MSLLWDKPTGGDSYGQFAICLVKLSGYRQGAVDVAGPSWKGLCLGIASDFDPILIARGKPGHQPR